MTRLERARGAHGEGETFVTNHRLDPVTRPLYAWASAFWWIREAAQVAASLSLDGYRAPHTRRPLPSRRRPAELG